MKSLLLLLAAVGLMIAGCGASVLGTQADLVALGGITAAQSDLVIVSARTHEIDAVKDAARHECGSGGCDEVRSAFHRSALEDVFSKWTPVLACRGPVVDALRGWADGIETAHRANTDSLGLDLLVILGRRFVSAYQSLVTCVETAAPGVDLPGLPPALGGAP